MHICIVSDGYPSDENPSFVFVQQLCIALADKGIRISVIAPQSISKSLLRGKSIEPRYSVFRTKDENIIEIYRPYVFSFGNAKGILRKISTAIIHYAVNKTFSNIQSGPNICYGHFWHNGYAILKSALKCKIPLFVATGESEIKFHQNYQDKTLKEFTDNVQGVICVSTKNKNESIDKGLTTEDKCIVIPNAVNLILFSQKNKYELRNNFGFGQDDFIVAFVGGFINRKGTKRIADAITFLNDKSIKSIFIGGGIVQKEDDPNCQGILFKGQLPHSLIADYLNCADIYVLPSLHEGSNNSIIEAMACGLPVVSSNLSFNYDTLDSSYSILVDPLNIQEIANAIKYLKDNPEVRKNMGEKALLASKKFDIQERAKKIIEFIEYKLK
jgi:glycosyltransferase involved in cell wall biosynthesis